MKCSMVGCHNEAIFHDEVPEEAKKMGIIGASFCGDHHGNKGAISRLHEALSKRRQQSKEF